MQSQCGRIGVSGFAVLLRHHFKHPRLFPSLPRAWLRNPKKDGVTYSCLQPVTIAPVRAWCTRLESARHLPDQCRLPLAYLRGSFLCCYPSTLLLRGCRRTSRCLPSRKVSTFCWRARVTGRAVNFRPVREHCVDGGVCGAMTCPFLPAAMSRPVRRVRILNMCLPFEPSHLFIMGRWRIQRLSNISLGGEHLTWSVKMTLTGVRGWQHMEYSLADLTTAPSAIVT
jgi:hypothetical protein